MQTGMLWYDNSKQSLERKVVCAAEHYYTKYGITPNLCFVNPTQLPHGFEETYGIQVFAERTVLPDHFWIGIAD
jgi:hypothetical protein